MKNILLTMLLSLFFVLHAVEIHDNNFKNMNLSSSLSYVLDENSTLNFEDIIQGKYNNIFIENNSSSVSPAYTKKTLWVKFSVTNKSSKEINTVLDLPIPWIDNIDLRTIRNGEVKQYKMGIYIPFYERSIVSPSFATAFTFKEDETIHFIIKASGNNSIIIAPVLHTKKDFEIKNTNTYIFNGIVGGVSFMVMLFSLVLYIRIRSTIFLYYSFFIGSVYFILGSYYGYNFQILFAEHIHLNAIIISSSISMYSFFGIIFTRRFLNTDKNMPTMNMLAKLLAYTLFIVFVSNFIVSDRILILNISMLLVSTTSVLILWIAILAYIRKISASKSFLYAWTLSNIASIITSLLVLGNFGYSESLYSLTGIAHMVDIILFSYALSERTLSLQKQNSDLKVLSNTDALTGIYNRRYFDEVANSLFNNKKRYNLPITIVMMDIDKFKEYNDYYGHKKGDECIVLVANAIKNELHRSTDIVARYGGEEFIVLVDGDISIAEDIVKRIELSIRSLAIEHVKYEGEIVTISQGISSVSANKISKIEDLIINADKALYESKKNGRDRYTIWQK